MARMVIMVIMAKVSRWFIFSLAVFLGTAAAARADYIEGLAAYVKGDYVTACKEFKSLAEQGNVKAQMKLGEINFKGHCGPQGEAEAFKWYGKVAKQGNAEAQISLGILYFDGKGVAQSDANAAIWYRKAAEQGNPMGEWMLGKMYFEGKGVPQSDSEAVNWYRKAAEQGDPAGQRLLGDMYGMGRGVPKDYVQAYMWLTLAFNGADSFAAEIRYLLTKNMTKEQIDEAKRLAEKWKPVKAKSGK